MRACSWLLAAVITVWTASACGASKDYPTRPIRLVTPTSPGTSNDIMSRVIAQALTAELSNQVIVDNRGGASGVIGMEIVKNAAPDGYTLAATSTTAMSITPNLRRKLPYDPTGDFEFISLFAITPNILAVGVQSPPRTVAEWMDWLKQYGTALNMASTGTGSQTHLTGTMLLDAAGLKSTHVPYKGGASVAVIAGESQWLIAPAASLMGHIRSLRLRGLGHTLSKPTPIIPGIPPIQETIPGFEYSGWIGLVAPKGTPGPILNKLRSALLAVLQKREVQEQFAAQATVIKTDTPEVFRKFVQQELREMHQLVARIGLKAE
jgi:tripartite-type tricarboxylate transporter receptor subunit TctC